MEVALKSLLLIVKIVLLVIITGVFIILMGDMDLLYFFLFTVGIYIALELFDYRIVKTREKSTGSGRKVIDDMLNKDIGVDEARKKEGREYLDFSEIVLNKYLGERNEKN